MTDDKKKTHATYEVWNRGGKCIDPSIMQPMPFYIAPNQTSPEYAAAAPTTFIPYLMYYCASTLRPSGFSLYRYVTRKHIQELRKHALLAVLSLLNGSGKYSGKVNIPCDSRSRKRFCIEVTAETRESGAVAAVAFSCEDGTEALWLDLSDEQAVDDLPRLCRQAAVVSGVPCNPGTEVHATSRQAEDRRLTGLNISCRDWAWLLGSLRHTERVLRECKVTPALLCLPERDVFTDAGKFDGPADHEEFSEFIDVLVKRLGATTV